MHRYFGFTKKAESFLLWNTDFFEYELCRIKNHENIILMTLESGYPIARLLEGNLIIAEYIEYNK